MSSGSEESKGEKELPEGKGAFDSHPTGGGNRGRVGDPGPPDLYPSPRKITSHLSQRLRKLNHQLFLLRTLAANTRSKRQKRRKRISFYPRTMGVTNSDLSAEKRGGMLGSSNSLQPQPLPLSLLSVSPKPQSQSLGGTGHSL